MNERLDLFIHFLKYDALSFDMLKLYFMVGWALFGFYLLFRNLEVW